MSPGGRDRRAAWIPLALVAAVLIVYGQVLDHEFIEFDDGVYVSRNNQVAQGLTWEGVRWSVSTFHMGNWHPLTWLSHMLDAQLFGLNPGAHHIVSVLIHAASAVVLFIAFRRMTGGIWPSAFVAAVFALHPLHVESVAWASERKDVLSALFWMLTLVAYARYVEKREWGRYVLVLVSFTLGLLAKSMLVTLPFVLLLLDVWPLRRWRLGHGWETDGDPPRRLILEKIPLFGLAAAFSAVALVAQRSVGAVGSLEALPFGFRLQNAVTSYVIYIWKSLWPAGLAYYYPHASVSGGSGTGTPTGALAAGLVLGVFVGVAIMMWRRRPYVAVGWFWYLGTLVPVIGLLQIGMQARADRYTYIPSVGLCIVLAWAVAEWIERSPVLRPVVSAIAGMVVLACAVATWIQVGHWKDSRTLAEHALRVTENNYQAHNMLGIVEQSEKDFEAALASYRRALEIKPDFSECQINLGTLLAEVGQLDEAARFFRIALRTNPGQAALRAHNGLGAVLERQNDLAGATEHLEKALELDPHFAEARNNLGVVFERLGRFDAARKQFEKALVASRDYTGAHRNLGGILQRQGDLAGAARHLHRALELDPDVVETRFKLAAVHARQGKLTEAVRGFEQVLELAPRMAEAHYNLGALFAELGDSERAIDHLERAVELKPDYPIARQALESLR